MSTHLRIPVTDEQKRTIMAASTEEPAGFAAWARAILLRAAREKGGGRKRK